MSDQAVSHGPACEVEVAAPDEYAGRKEGTEAGADEEQLGHKSPQVGAHTYWLTPYQRTNTSGFIRGIMAYVIQLNSYKITENYQSDAMVEALQCLVEEHDLLENISLPYKMRKKALLNTSPTHPNGTEMGPYVMLAENLYLNVDIPGRTKLNQLENLARICDVEVAFENWPNYSRKSEP